MHAASALLGLLLLGTSAIPAKAQVRSLDWGVQGSLGFPTGDLKDTAGSGLCPGLGVHADFNLSANQTIRARLDGLFFRSARKDSAGTSGGNPWVRTLETKAQGWALGAEYLTRPFQKEPRLRLGIGLNLVKWSLDTTSSLTMTSGTNTGTVVAGSTPTWTKVGVSALATYQLSPRWSAEVRILSSSYGWEGERVQVGQLGLAWTF
jgi:hypothetical protein